MTTTYHSDYVKNLILGLIGCGPRQAVTRLQLQLATGLRDREIRSIIEELRRDYCICNMQDGRGYYLPDWEDSYSIRAFIRQQESRMQAIERSLSGAKKELERREKVNGQQYRSIPDVHRKPEVF